MDSQEYKTYIAVVAIALGVISYIPYIRDMIKGKTEPHIFTWFFGAFLALIISRLQFIAGGGIGARVTFVMGMIAFFVFLGSLKSGKKHIKRIDILFLAISIIGLAFWLIAKKPLISNIILTTITIAAFLPTFRKSWNSPHTETMSTYGIDGMRHILGAFSLSVINLGTLLYPLILGLFNLLLFFVIYIRRGRLRIGSEK